MTTGSAVQGQPTPDPATSGLEGIVAARTPLSEVDGLKGVLTIRGYDIEVPRNAVVPIDADLGDAALQMMERNMHAKIV